MNNSITTPRTLRGFHDLLPRKAERRRRIGRLLEEIFASFGFLPIDTPMLEYAEILLGKGGGETEKQVYRFLDHGGRDVALRFDLTVPLARFVAQHLDELPLPFRRYHIAKVFRGENTQRGRYREFMQCDFDIIGVDTMGADFEIVLLIVQLFERLGIADVTLHVSDRGLFEALLSRLDLSGQAAEILRTVDKLRKVGEEATHDSLLRFASSEQTQAIMRFITSSGEEALTTAAESTGRDDLLSGLRSVVHYAGQVGIAERLRVDLSITRGLDYYTGLVFELFLDRLPSIGSVCSGGRYNDLASLYSDRHLPGVGGSIGVDRLLSALEELELQGEAASGNGKSGAIVLCLDEGLVGHYQRIAGRFRAEGIDCQVYPEMRRLAVQFAYAERLDIAVGIICGPDEVERQQVNIRDLQSRESHDGFDIDSAIDTARAILQRHGSA